MNTDSLESRQTQDALESLDLRHLRTLAVLLAECSITTAAHRCGLDQPAASRMLARMRRVFSDPLLVRSGAKMVLTERGAELRAPLYELLAQIQRISVMT